MIEVGSKTELCELGEKYGTDKTFYYTPFYHSLLKDRRTTTKKVLELGIGYPELMLDSLSRVGKTRYTTGASLYVWQDYFPEAHIFALDNRPDILINEGRITSLYCDQTDERTYPLNKLGKNFDLIVEDGLHERTPQLLAIRMLMPLLAPDGIYITEDLGYLPREERRELYREIDYPAELHEFHNPKLGEHIAAVMVIRKWT